MLGTAFATKMAAYVGIAPAAGAFGHLLPRRSLLVALDRLRAGVAIALPFVTDIGQVDALIVLLLYLNFSRLTETLIVMLSVPYALGVWSRRFMTLL